jgi:hypothetical protein
VKTSQYSGNRKKKSKTVIKVESEFITVMRGGGSGLEIFNDGRAFVKLQWNV